jgi:hypothetical protein
VIVNTVLVVMIYDKHTEIKSNKKVIEYLKYKLGSVGETYFDTLNKLKELLNK